MKKQLLFYIFLGIFVSTTIVGLLGITSVITIKDKYLTPLFYAFIIELAGAVICIYKKANFFDEESNSFNHKNNQNIEKNKSKESQDSIIIAQPNTVLKSNNIPNLSLIESAIAYFNKLEELEGRFYEQQEFINNFNGTKVSWSGYISSVSGGISENEEIRIIIKVNDDVLNMSFFLAHFPFELKTKLFSLNKKDFVRITGIAVTNVYPPLCVDAGTIELINK